MNRFRRLLTMALKRRKNTPPRRPRERIYLGTDHAPQEQCAGGLSRPSARVKAEDPSNENTHLKLFSGYDRKERMMTILPAFEG